MARDAHYTTGLKNLDLLFENGGAEEEEIINRKVLLAIKHQEFSDAIKYGTQIKQSSKDTLYLIGFAYAKMKQLQKALTTFKKVQSIDPNYKKTNDYVEKLTSSLEQKKQKEESIPEENSNISANDNEKKEEKDQITTDKQESVPQSVPLDSASSQEQENKEQESTDNKSNTTDTQLQNNEQKVTNDQVSSQNNRPAVTKYDDNSPILTPKQMQRGNNRSFNDKRSKMPSASATIKRKFEGLEEVRALKTRNTSRTINLQNANQDGHSTKTTLADLYGLTDESQNFKSLAIAFFKFLTFLIIAGGLFYVFLFLDTL